MWRHIFAAFWSGFAAMGLEMSLARLSTPYFGSSLPVWAVIISFVLLSIALGYRLGGRLSLREQFSRYLGLGLFVAAMGNGFLSLGGHALLGWAAGTGKGVHPALGIAALCTIAALAAIPLISLSAVLPLCIRAGVTRTEDAGNVAARVHASATIGSIAGTLVPAFVMLPHLGLRVSFIILAFGCLVASVLLSRSWIRFFLGISVIVLASIVSPKMPGRHPIGSRILLDTETAVHARVIVRERGSGLRELLVDEAWSIQSIYDPRGLSPTGVWPSFRIAPGLIRKGAPQRVLIIGLAGGTVARDLSLLYENVTIDGVDIDAELVEIASKYMGLQDSINVYIQDGRRFLSQTEQKYDLILLDAYRDLYIPEHLATTEFFELASRHLRPGGVVAANVLFYRDEKLLAEALGNTMANVFNVVDVLENKHSLNMLLFGYQHKRGDTRISHNTHFRSLSRRDPLAEKRSLLVRPFTPKRDLPIFTDDKSPIAPLTHRIAWRVLFKSNT